MYKEPRTAVIVRMSAETFEALENPENDRKLEVEFGDNPVRVLRSSPTVDCAHLLRTGLPHRRPVLPRTTHAREREP